MRIIRFGEDNVAINIDRIDGLCFDLRSNITQVYMGGSEKPFGIKKPLDEVLQIIANYHNLGDFENRGRKDGD